MFAKCVEVFLTKEKSTSDVMAEAIDKLSHVLPPAKSILSTTPFSSPVRVIESRSKC